MDHRCKYITFTIFDFSKSYTLELYIYDLKKNMAKGRIQRTPFKLQRGEQKSQQMYR